MLGRMRSVWCPVMVSALLVGIVSAGQARRTDDQAVVVARCRDLFGNVDLPGTHYRRQVRREEKVERRAREYFRTWSAGDLREGLTPLLKGYKASDVRYVSIAYTLAYHGVDVDRNSARMLRFIRTGRDGLALDTAGVSLATVYRRHPSAAVLRDILVMHGDGENQDTYNAIRIAVFLKYPARVLRSASADKSAMGELTATVSGSGEIPDAEAEAISPVLRTYSRNHDAKVAAAAKRLLTAVNTSADV